MVPQFGFEKITKAKLIEHIEQNGLFTELQELVGVAWNEREENVKLNRRPRF